MRPFMDPAACMRARTIRQESSGIERGAPAARARPTRVQSVTVDVAGSPRTSRRSSVARDERRIVTTSKLAAVQAYTLCAVGTVATFRSKVLEAQADPTLQQANRIVKA